MCCFLLSGFLVVVRNVFRRVSKVYYHIGTLYCSSTASKVPNNKSINAA